MIYLKENNKIITANLFVHKDFENKKAELYYISKIETDIGKPLVRNIYTESTFDNFSKTISNKEFNSLNFKQHSSNEKSICEEDVYNEIEKLINSNLPIELKKKYLKTIQGFYRFERFVNDFLPSVELKTYRTYEIEKLKEIAQLSENSDIYTEAADIVSKENLKTANENSKVLKLTKMVSELGEIYNEK